MGRSPSSARSRGIIGATLRDTANPTMLKAGYKANVIPATAEAVVDCRVLPGRQAAFEREVDELIGPDVTREWITRAAAVRDHVRRRSRRCDERRDCSPSTPTPVPSRTCCPAAPMRKPSPAWAFAASASSRCGCRPELDFAALFHGVDERVPVDALHFGTEVLEHFLEALLTTTKGHSWHLPTTPTTSSRNCRLSP